MRTTFAIVASSLMAVTSISAQSAETANAVQKSVSGTWTGTYGTPGGPRPLNLIFKVDGMKITGTVKRETGDLPIVGQVKGDSVVFAYTVTYNEHPLEMGFVAKVTGDVMKGVVDFAGQGQDVFEARRASAPPK
ncbi:MAG: hypothetical protein ABJB66_14735 [Gemmatimonadaceae bacterium]